MNAWRQIADAVAAEFSTDEPECPDGHDPDKDYKRLGAIVERRCSTAWRTVDPSKYIVGVPAVALALTEHPNVNVAASALCALGAKFQEPAPKLSRETLRKGGLSAKIWTAKSGLPSLGRGLRRPGLMAAAEAILPGAVSVMAIVVLATVEEVTDDILALRNAASQLQPAAAGCLRQAASLPAGPDLDAVTAARCAARIACVAAAERGLPGGEPLLLQHLELCRAGLEADRAGPAPATASKQGAPAAGGESAAAAPAGQAAGGGAADADACGGGAAAEDGGSLSPWAVPLNDTLHALVTLWTGAGGIPDAGATAAVRASVALASRKPAAEDAGLQWRCTAAAPATDARVCKGMELLLRLRGPAAAAVHRELLGQLVGALERATASVVQAFPERKAADGGRSAASDAPAPEPAALAGASRLPPPCAGAAKHAARPQRRPTVTHPGSVALAGLITLGTCIQGITDACLKEKGVRPLLAPGSDSGRAWAAAIAAALATAARCCTHGAPEASLEQRFSAFVAGSVLASTAAALLRLFVAAGLEALHQDAGVQLMEALAAHLAPVVGKELPPLFQALPDMEAYRKAGSALAAAVEAVSVAGEGSTGRASHGASNQQRGQQQRLPSSLIRAACAGAIALTRDETRPIIMATQRAGPDQGYQATQKGARLVIRLLQANVPLAAHFMAAFKAASHLVTKLEHLAGVPWYYPQIVPAVVSLCQALALLAQQCPEHREMYGDGESTGPLAWLQLAGQIQQQAQQLPASKRLLVERALAGATQAMEDSAQQEPSATIARDVAEAKALETGPSPSPSQRPAVNGAAGSSAASGAHRAAVAAGLAAAAAAGNGTAAAPVAAGRGAARMQRTAADADAAMAALLAEEEGCVPAAAPSKAALKRARRKAAAAAAAAALPGQVHEGEEAGSATPPNPSGVHSQPAAHPPAAAGHAPAQGGGTATSPAADAAPPAAEALAVASDSTAAQSGTQELRLQDEAAAAGSTPPAPRVPEWMKCPLTHALLVDPVLCTGDEQTYERAAITQWLAASDVSPVTEQPLASQDLVPNHTLRSIIQAAQDRALRRQNHSFGV